MLLLETDVTGTFNIEGEWANQIQMLPVIPRIDAEMDRVQLFDSNMFVTTAIAYPLYWVDDEDARIADMARAGSQKCKDLSAWECI